MRQKLNIKFKQKDLLIKKIATDYKKNKFFENETLKICESESLYLNNDHKYYIDLKGKVDYILVQLDRELSQVIYNEYFSNRIENWWMYYYSKSTYYRMKNKAMDSFLEWWYV